MKLKTVLRASSAIVVIVASFVTGCCDQPCGFGAWHPAYPPCDPAVAAAYAASPDARLFGKAFPTREAAMAAVADACGTADKARVDEIFGPGATEVLWSGDEVADKAAALRVKAMIETKLAWSETSDDESTVAVVGNEKWPFPIPLVKTASGWKFDLEQGKDELLSRRIGRNELHVISTFYEYVQAQKEYFSQGRDGNPPAYAQKVRSAAGKHDGLYWETKEGEEPSPFGPLIADARKAGYAEAEQAQPYHGYNFRILTAQGAGVPGGRKSYVDSKGLMTGGFAAIAWPETYGNSGIMTFLVSSTGVVFEKNLGNDTDGIASAMTEYAPDTTWFPSARKPEIDDDDNE